MKRDKVYEKKTKTIKNQKKKLYMNKKLNNTDALNQKVYSLRSAVVVYSAGISLLDRHNDRTVASAKTCVCWGDSRIALL